MSKKQNALPYEVTFKLIKEVERRPCVWNAEHADYNNKYHLKQAWMSISEELNLPEKMLRSKWKNLRDTYRRLEKKTQKNRHLWPHYGLLNFLVFNGENENGNAEVDTSEVDLEEEATSDPEDTGPFIKFELPEVTEETVYLEEDPIPDKRRRRSEDVEDYDIMFLKSLAPYFKQLDPIRKLVVRSRMQNMLLNEIAAQAAKPKAKS